MDDTTLPVTAILSALPVRDLETARPFYERLFGRAPDSQPMPGLAQWELAGAGTVQLVVDEDRAGGGLATLVFGDLAAAADVLRARGVDVESGAGEVVTAFARLEDSDGNALTLVQA